MSLSVSARRFQDAFVASFAPMPPAQIAPSLATFSTLARPMQSTVLHSAHFHLSRVESIDRRFLDSVRGLAERLAGAEEPPAMMELTVSTLRSTWELHRRHLEGESVEPQARPVSDRPAQPETQPSVSTFARVSTPVPPPMTETVSGPARLLSPLPPAPAVPDIEVRAPTPVPPPEALEENDATTKLYPALWWSLPKPTRLDLKSRALAREGAVSALNQSEEAHAQFLVDTLAKWIEEAREGGLNVKERKGRAEAVNQAMAQRLAMAQELTTLLRGSSVEQSPLANFFWERAAESSSLRLAVRRLSNRDLQTRLDDAGRARVDEMTFGLQIGILERFLLPLFLGSLPAGEKDESQGQVLAQQFGQHLDHLPISDRRRLTPDQLEHLSQVESILRVAAVKLRDNPQSEFVKSFLANVQGDLSRIPSIVAMIRRKREGEGQAS